MELKSTLPVRRVTYGPQFAETMKVLKSTLPVRRVTPLGSGRHTRPSLKSTLPVRRVTAVLNNPQVRGYVEIRTPCTGSDLGIQLRQLLCLKIPAPRTRGDFAAPTTPGLHVG